MKVKVEMAPEEMIAAVKCYEELKAYRATGYTPEQVQELHDNNLNSSKGWIPCSERMPERGIGVRVYAKRDDAGYQFDAFVAFHELKWFTYDLTKTESLENNAVDNSYEITHWMPYPEPPSEK